MQNLEWVLLFKIVFTALLWFVPLLFFPLHLLQRIGLPSSTPTIFLRFLGMAYGSLLVGYLFGLFASLQGAYPRSTVWVGIVSNLGAFLLLAVAAYHGCWRSWGPMARVVMWTSLAATGLIATGLIAFGPCSRYSEVGQRNDRLYPAPSAAPKLGTPVSEWGRAVLCVRMGGDRSGSRTVRLRGGKVPSVRHVEDQLVYFHQVLTLVRGEMPLYRRNLPREVQHGHQ